MRLMEITRELGIEDHTKVVFHLQILKEAGSSYKTPKKLIPLPGRG